MMLFALLKKDFLIVKKYVLIMLVVIALNAVGGHRSKITAKSVRKNFTESNKSIHFCMAGYSLKPCFCPVRNIRYKAVFAFMFLIVSVFIGNDTV